MGGFLISRRVRTVLVDVGIGPHSDPAAHRQLHEEPRGTRSGSRPTSPTWPSPTCTLITWGGRRTASGRSSPTPRTGAIRRTGTSSSGPTLRRLARRTADGRPARHRAAAGAGRTGRDLERRRNGASRHRCPRRTRPHPGKHGAHRLIGTSSVLILLGDVVHCPAELLEDDWEMISDVDRALAQRTRVALAREFEGTDIPMAATHFPGCASGASCPARASPVGLRLTRCLPRCRIPPPDLGLQGQR